MGDDRTWKEPSVRRHLQVIVVLIAALPWWPAHTAEPLGRLFFTPAQRNALDAGKHVRTSQISPASAVRVPREVTLNGVVTRSDGESTVWVNGRALDKRPASGVSATASGSDPAAARVKLGGASNTVKMRVGQRLQRSTGKIAEPYESIVGRIEVGTPVVGQETERTTRKKPTKSNSGTKPEQVSDH